ncbi:aromatic amino acid ammonia-lyase [Saccharothrix sp. S26]|uniref:aromatic amino acid ammonia-lyase n=1 Tax=Saccharothrix sp. S26 TaxID=2907215 RepID=UPI001F36F3D4|nr:aromatic amino acid ammonia-lyase [Saccharothrix sp. S26]MCE6994965.1 aromatic amino acid ammonia-lyase [Saccharothrix sp. S26]
MPVQGRLAAGSGSTAGTRRWARRRTSALSDRVARLALVLRANTMARGTTRVRPEYVDRIL